MDYAENCIYETGSLPRFLKQTETLAGKLKKLSAKKLGQLMDISSDLATLNHQRYQAFELPKAVSSFVQPAASVFSGEVYKGLDFNSLNQQEQERAQEQIRILSGLYGILKPLDLIYPYRLEMGTSFAVTPKIKNLYAFWGTTLSQSLSEETSPEEEIINLASGEYFKVLQPKKINRKIITPVFKEYKNDSYKVVMIFAKHARGAMARYIVQNKINYSEALKNYQQDGYRFHEALSSETEWVFTR